MCRRIHLDLPRQLISDGTGLVGFPSYTVWATRSKSPHTWQAVWNLPSGDLPYAEIEITEIEYDPVA